MHLFNGRIGLGSTVLPVEGKVSLSLNYESHIVFINIGCFVGIKNDSFNSSAVNGNISFKNAVSIFLFLSEFIACDFKSLDLCFQAFASSDNFGSFNCSVGSVIVSDLYPKVVNFIVLSSFVSCLIQIGNCSAERPKGRIVKNSVSCTSCTVIQFNGIANHVFPKFNNIGRTNIDRRGIETGCDTFFDCFCPVLNISISLNGLNVYVVIHSDEVSKSTIRGGNTCEVYKCLNCGCSTSVNSSYKSIVLCSLIEESAAAVFNIEAAGVSSICHISIKSVYRCLICSCIISILLVSIGIGITIIAESKSNAEFAVPVVSSLLSAAAKNISIGAESILSVIFKKSSVGHCIGVHVRSIGSSAVAVHDCKHFGKEYFVRSSFRAKTFFLGVGNYVNNVKIAVPSIITCGIESLGSRGNDFGGTLYKSVKSILKSSVSFFLFGPTTVSSRVANIVILSLNHICFESIQCGIVRFRGILSIIGISISIVTVKSNRKIAQRVPKIYGSLFTATKTVCNITECVLEVIAESHIVRRLIANPRSTFGNQIINLLCVKLAIVSRITGLPTTSKIAVNRKCLYVCTSVSGSLFPVCILIVIVHIERIKDLIPTVFSYGCVQCDSCGFCRRRNESKHCANHCNRYDNSKNSLSHRYDLL